MKFQGHWEKTWGQMLKFFDEWDNQVYSFSVRRSIWQESFQKLWVSWPTWLHFISWTYILSSDMLCSCQTFQVIIFTWWDGRGDKPTRSCPEPPKFWFAFCVPTEGKQSSDICASLPLTSNLKTWIHCLILILQLYQLSQ